MNADTPWTTSAPDMSSTPTKTGDAASSSAAGPGTPSQPVTIAPFSPNQQTARARTRGSVIIHQKTPLLIATPPQVTRALAYSHPFVLPLNHFAGLLSWTTNDAWESFLLLSAFWFVVLYGDVVLRWTGPVILVFALILAMYGRRYSPLSSTAWSGTKSKRKQPAQSSEEQRKSLDEILETLQTLTSRCDVLLDPFLRLTEFLSTQSSATQATTRPALTSLFLRILALTPLWIVLSLPPVGLITTQRVVLVWGTLGLTYHSRPARVTRTLLWRSRSVRALGSLLTGLQFSGPTPAPLAAKPALPPTLPKRPQGSRKTTSTTTTPPSTEKTPSSTLRFTFSLHENQRRWIGLGWTPSLLAYERQPYTDEHLNPTPSPADFTLPDTEGEHEPTRWRWAENSSWRVEGAATTPAEREKSAKRIGGGGGGDDAGWTYYDTKWEDPRKVDGWGRYTRRRRWVRDAELVEIAPTPPVTDAAATTTAVEAQDTAKRKGGGWFASSSAGSSKPRHRATASVGGDRSDAGSGSTGGTGRVRDEGPDADVLRPIGYRQTDWDRSIGEGLMEWLS